MIIFILKTKKIKYNIYILKLNNSNNQSLNKNIKKINITNFNWIKYLNKNN